MTSKEALVVTLLPGDTVDVRNVLRLAAKDGTPPDARPRSVMFPVTVRT